MLYAHWFVHATRYQRHTWCIYTFLAHCSFNSVGHKGAACQSPSYTNLHIHILILAASLADMWKVLGCFPYQLSLGFTSSSKLKIQMTWQLSFIGTVTVLILFFSQTHSVCSNQHMTEQVNDCGNIFFHQTPACHHNLLTENDRCLDYHI